MKEADEIGKIKNSALLPVLVIVSFLFFVLIGGIVWVAAKKPLVLKQIIETNISTVVKEVLPASEYVCLVYNYQSITQRSYNPGNLINARSILIVLDGTIKLGFDCQNIRVRQNGNELILSMPNIRILAHEQYPERAKTYDLAGGGLFPRSIKVQEILDLLGDTKLDQEKQVEENADLMRQAKESAEALFKPLLELNPSVKDRYLISFRWQ
ncbi:MAG: DUF4230 domain-containing protein [Treponema sp.]|nr:DUF4230 domain-containing protein [Treponema sp.]MCL2272450.1 DUF4230 domain-containing protein [Treponema sp.]